MEFTCSKTTVKRRKKRKYLLGFIYLFRLYANIWLITDQANVSWPVSIGFVWPSVLEDMSSTLSHTPVVLDFHLILTDSTKVN